MPAGSQQWGAGPAWEQWVILAGLCFQGAQSHGQHTPDRASSQCSWLRRESIPALKHCPDQLLPPTPQHTRELRIVLCFTELLTKLKFLHTPSHNSWHLLILKYNIFSRIFLLPNFTPIHKAISIHMSPNFHHHSSLKEDKGEDS